MRLRLCANNYTKKWNTLFELIYDLQLHRGCT